MNMHMPKPVPLNRASRRSRRVINADQSRKLAKLFVQAERDALAAIDSAMADARRTVSALYTNAFNEAEAILAELPDFDVLAALPARKGKSAFGAIRGVADRYGLAMAGITRRGNGQDRRHTAVQAEAVRAVHDACPSLTDAEIGALFSALPARTVRRYIEGC